MACVSVLCNFLSTSHKNLKICGRRSHLTLHLPDLDLEVSSSLSEILFRPHANIGPETYKLKSKHTGCPTTRMSFRNLGASGSQHPHDPDCDL